MALNPAFRRGAFNDRQLWALSHGLCQEDARFWRNYAALAALARSDLAPPYPDDRQVALEPLMKLHWVHRTLERLPWQIRELLGEPTPSSVPRIPAQRRSPERFPRPINNRGGRG